MNSFLEVYPNPASTQAVINFSIDSDALTEIVLFDLQGRKIKSIAEENFEAGNHQLNCSVTELPKGIYFLQLKTNEVTATQKLIIQ